MDGDQPRARGNRRDDAAAVFGEVILRAVADVEPGDHAGGNPAAPAEEPVREIAKGRSVQDFDVSQGCG